MGLCMDDIYHTENKEARNFTDEPNMNAWNFLEEQNYLYYLGSKDQLNKNGNEMMFTKLFLNTEFFHFWFGYLSTFELNS